MGQVSKNYLFGLPVFIFKRNFQHILGNALSKTQLPGFSKIYSYLIYFLKMLYIEIWLELDQNLKPIFWVSNPSLMATENEREEEKKSWN